MARDINDIITEIRRLEDQLETYLDDLRAQFHYRLEGQKVQFDTAVKAVHRTFKTSLPGYVLNAPLGHLLTAPIIYSMILPILLLDIFITVYQHICFRAYGITRVKRRDYIAFDRHRLGYLNAIQKVNCLYCGYANGLIGYSREIIARTEQYWCPIKHARRLRGKHQHYYKYAEYGDAENFQEQQIDLREEFSKNSKG